MTTEQTIEQRAAAMGWQSKEEFKGDPEKWTSAEDFVARGESLMPILKANNRRLNEKVDTQAQQLQTLQAQLSEAQQSIEALKDFNSKENRQKMRDSLEQTKAQIKEAREANDIDREVELTQQLNEGAAALKEAEKEPEKKAAPQQNQQDFTKDPEWLSWTAENEWFGKDRRKTGLAMGVAAELKAADPSLKGKKLLDRVTEEVGKLYPDVLPPNKVESGGNRASGGEGSPRSKGKSYSDLPREAQEACDGYASRLVGPNKAYKTVEEWRKQYTTEYFQGEQS